MKIIDQYEDQQKAIDIMIEILKAWKRDKGI